MEPLLVVLVMALGGFVFYCGYLYGRAATWGDACRDLAAHNEAFHTDWVENPLPGAWVYCGACSAAGGAERAIYHGPPACKGGA